MKILIFSGFYLPGYKGGGPIRTISNMIEQVGDEIKFSLYTSDRDLDETTPYSSIKPDTWQRSGNADVFYSSPASGWFSTLWKTIKDFQGDAVHFNSFFSFRFSIIPLFFWLLLKHGKPIILGPRGEFSPGALAIKSRKKKLFINFFKASRLHTYIVWHASTSHEATDIRRVMGDDVTIRLAIDIAKPGSDIPIDLRKKGSPLRLVFISRISPKKNLLGAIEILKKVKNEIVFDIYGPIEDKNYWETCCSASKHLPSNIKFFYRGSLHPSDVPQTLAKYDLFFFPTMGENFGHVIAESLSAGLPLLISDATPWRNLEEKFIGWDFPLSNKYDFSSCIDRCFEKTPEEYYIWRKNIRAWAVENIGNKDAIEQNRQLFMNLN